MLEKIGYSIEEAAEILGVGRTVMCALIRDGEVASVKIGRRRIVPAESLRNYLRKLIEAQQGAMREAV
jgi:excisionase family DNA binding protein